MINSIRLFFIYLWGVIKGLFVKPKKGTIREVKELRAILDQQRLETQARIKSARSYANMKDTWVGHKDYKQKTKLRAIIRDAAIKLAKYNDKNYNENRLKLIEAYDEGGLDNVAKYIQKELDVIIKSKSASTRH